MALVLFSTIFKLFILDRPERIRTLKNFKKGKFVLMYVITIPLFFAGYWELNPSFISALSSSLKASVDLIVLELDSSWLISNFGTTSLYTISITIAYVLIMLNAITFAATLLWERIYNINYLLKIRNENKKIYVLVGYNKENNKIINSILKNYNRRFLLQFLYDNRHSNIKTKELVNIFYSKKAENKEKRKNAPLVLIVDTDSTDKSIQDYCYINKVAYIKLANKNIFNKILADLIQNVTKKNVNIIINTGSDDTNLLLTKNLVNLSNAKFDELGTFVNNDGVNVYVFGNPLLSANYLHFESQSHGYIKYINKYKLISTDFIFNHPLTEHMTEDHIDYSTALVKDNVDINCILIGFGKTNKEIFLNSVANNQFIQKVKKENEENNDVNEKKDEYVITVKPVNYYLFDKQDNNSKEINYTLNRYEDWKKYAANHKEEYNLEIAPSPANVFTSENSNIIKTDINSKDFFMKIYDIISKSTLSVNQIVIAFGSDMENMNFAYMLSHKLKEWRLDNTYIYVKYRNGKTYENIIKDEINESDHIEIFGNEDEIVYNIDKIVKEEFDLMAKEKHFCYKCADKVLAEQKGFSLNQDIESTILKNAVKSWYEWSPVQRRSNTYACMSLRFKLNLIGYDYTTAKIKSDELTPIEKEFLNDYEKNNPIIYDPSYEPIKGRKMVDYSHPDIKDTLRYNFVCQEHYRWNAYMIINGFILCKASDIQNEKNNGKDFNLRRHCNLTTMEGLEKFRQVVAKKKGTTEEKEDVIHYDYQIMDDIIWLLKKNGYTIVKK